MTGRISVLERRKSIDGIISLQGTSIGGKAFGGEVERV
jgi:hypothetical protein